MLIPSKREVLIAIKSMIFNEHFIYDQCLIFELKTFIVPYLFHHNHDLFVESIKFSKKLLTVLSRLKYIAVGVTVFATVNLQTFHRKPEQIEYSDLQQKISSTVTHIV